MSTEKQLIFSARPKDFRVDTFCTGGPGGQNQNKKQMGVRITHTGTGLSSECREHRSQSQNKRAAFQKLAKLLVAHILNEAEPERKGSGVVVRTYHEPDDRVVDHRTGVRDSYVEVIGKCKLDKFIVGN